MSIHASEELTSPIWMPPSRDALDAMFQRRLAERPEFVYLTLILKLRTTRWKEAILAITQLRYTNMKATVLKQFQKDLAAIVEGSVDGRLISAVSSSVQAVVADNNTASRNEFYQALRGLGESFSGTMFIRALFIALTNPDADLMPDLQPLCHVLEEWNRTHPDEHLRKTLQGLEKARTRPKKGLASQEQEEGVPRFTPKQLERIRLMILLRKMLTERLTAQLQCRELLSIASDIADEQREEQREILLARLTRRSDEQTNQRLIALLCERFVASESPPTKQEIENFRTYLQQLFVSQKLALRRDEHQHGATGKRVAFLWTLLEQLVAQDELASDAFSILRLQLMALSTQKKARGTIGNNGSSAADANSLRSYVQALTSWLAPCFDMSTDVLVLLELAEAAERGLNDGVTAVLTTLQRCYTDFCSTYAYPLGSVLRSSVFQDCAKSLVSWAALVAEYRIERLKGAGHFPLLLAMNGGGQQGGRRQFFNNPYRGRRFVLLPSLYAYWLREDAAYKESAATEMPLGPDAGKKFGSTDAGRQRKWVKFTHRRTTTLKEQFVGKRGVRRLHKWLLDEATIRETLRHLETLLYPRHKPKELVLQARQAPHPYWTNKKRKRKILAQRPAQYRESKAGTRVPFGSLDRTQWITLRNQLQEQLRYKVQLEAIQPKITRFLQDAPPSYPLIAPLYLDPQRVRSLPGEVSMVVKEDFEQRYNHYRRALNRFYDFRPRRGDPYENYSEEQLFDIYTLAAQELEQAAALFTERNGQPISYNRTMGVKYDPKAFALLTFEHEAPNSKGRRYVLACEFSGEEAPERSLLHIERSANKTPQFFVNRPSYQVEPEKGNSSLMYFALDMGAKYQGRLLHDVLQLQEQREQQETEQAFENAITSLNLVQGRDRRGHKAWYAHLPIPVRTAPCLQQPNAAIGFHEYGGNYYYAVINLSGAVINLGELTLPDYLTTKNGRESDNYVFGMAQAIMRLSVTADYTAYIGIQDTLWKTRAPSLDSEDNKMAFGHPRKRIHEVTIYKAQIKGLLEPISVRLVAPSRDCGFCGRRHENSGIRRYPTTHCFICTAQRHKHALEYSADGRVGKLRCTHCQRYWEKKEPQFKCLKCGKRQHARFNAATVVARRLLDQLTSGQADKE